MADARTAVDRTGARSLIRGPVIPIRLWIYLLTAVVVAADQATKAWMSAALADGRTISVAAGLAWELTQNNGAAFGVLEDANVKLIFAAAAAVLLILYWARQVTTVPMACALGLLLGGAIGNLIDRVRLGHVVDFIALQYGGRTVFPNFNIADSAITIGACLLAYAWYRSEQARGPRRPTTVEPAAEAPFAPLPASPGTAGGPNGEAPLPQEDAVGR